MAKNKESRLAQILREELKSGSGLAKALVEASNATNREKSDIRNVFPKTGVLGQILEQALGKGYRYKGKKSASASSDPTSISSALGAGAIRLTARNTMVLPAMARDMNIMKQNMQLLVRSSGKKAYSRPESDFHKFKIGGPKKAAPKSAPSAGTGGSSALEKMGTGMGLAGTVVSGLVSGLFTVLTSGLSIAGSVLGSAASLIGTALSGILGVGGSVASTIFGGLASVVGGMGIFGLVALAGAGFLVYQISKSIKGELSFDKVMDYIKESLGFKEGESFRDALMRGLGFIDEKTGLNTKGAFEKVETKFIYWLEYSKSMFSQVATTVQKFGELAILELQSGFLTYGTGLIKLLAQIYGTAIGAKAGVSGAGLASILMGSALGPAGSMGAMALRGLIAGGSFAGLTALGYSAGSGAGDAINDALAGTALNQDQKDVLEKMKNTKGFIDGLNRVNQLTEEINLLKQYKRPDGSPTYDEKSSDIVRRRKEIEDITGNPTFSPIFKQFEKAFGKAPGNIHEDAISQAKSNLDTRRQQILSSIPTPGAMRSEADQAATEKVTQHEESMGQRPSRYTTAGGNGKINRNSGVSIKMGEVIDYFMAKGLSYEAAVGIATNLFEESKLDANAVNKSSGAYGIAQWLDTGNGKSPRQSNFKKWADANGFAYNNPQAQLDYVWQELQTSHRGVLTKLQEPGITASKAHEIFLSKFEAPSDADQARRRSDNLVSNFSPSMQTASTTTAKEEKRKKELADPYAGKSDVELLLAAFGSMFGDLATSILELAEAGNKQAAANAGTDKGGGNVSSASSLNNDVLISEIIQSHMARQFV
jgi:hypothetical protein